MKFVVVCHFTIRKFVSSQHKKKRRSTFSMVNNVFEYCYNLDIASLTKYSRQCSLNDVDCMKTNNRE